MEPETSSGEVSEGGEPGYREHAAQHMTADQHEAKRRIDAHLADPGGVAEDRKAAGGRIRTATAALGAVGLGALGLGVAFREGGGAALALGLGVGGVASIIALVLLVFDLTIQSREPNVAPEAALKGFFKAIAMGRDGYAWAMLCPTAREQTVSAPNLGPVVTAPGTFSLERPAGMKAYARSFARGGGNQLRSMSVRHVAVSSNVGDVATVEAKLRFFSWPQWVGIVTALGFVLFRPLLIVGVILYFSQRKRHEVTITKTLLKGKDGLWYVFDADILELASAFS